MTGPQSLTGQRMLVFNAMQKRQKKKSDISLVLVVKRRHSVGRLRRAGGEEGLTADSPFFLGFCAAAIVNLSEQSGEWVC